MTPGLCLPHSPILPKLTSISADLLFLGFHVYSNGFTDHLRPDMETVEFMRRLKILVLTFAMYLALC